MLRYLTGGESHGPALTAILDGMPSNLKLDFDRIAEMMRLRKSGYGRGGRQAIETDGLRFLGGVRNGVTTGAPVVLQIDNLDYENWRQVMDAASADVALRRVTAVRPGHADLTGCLKFGHTDARNVLERASARETAARVAVGAVCRELLLALGADTRAHVYEIGGVRDDGEYSFDEIVVPEDSLLRVVDAAAERRMIAAIDAAGERGDTLGGRVRVALRGLKPGLGDFTQYDRKFDAALAAAMMSIQAVKGVEIGLGFGFSQRPGSKTLDEICLVDGKFRRRTNRAGGIEGGMTNGEDVVVSLAMKPIPTLRRRLGSVDLVTKQPVEAAFERSDVCAVTALSVVAECAACFEAARFLLDAAGSRNFTEIRDIWNRSECL